MAVTVKRTPIALLSVFSPGLAEMGVSPALDPRFIVTEALPSVPVVTSSILSSSTTSPPIIDVLDVLPLPVVLNTSATPETGLSLKSNTSTTNGNGKVVLTSPV